MDADSERFIIQAARSGSEKAWRQLFEHHFEAVYRFCLALASGHHDIAEELTQPVFVTAARRIHRFDPSRAAFRVWLFGVAKNRNMTIRAGQQRRKKHKDSFADSRTDETTREAPDLRVYEALARLPSHYRIVLDAKYLRGLSMNEIAADSGSSIEAIESLLRRARACFAREYEQIRTTD